MAEYDRCHRAVLSQGGQWPTSYPLETMLRIHCMQHWYNLSDGAMEDALYEIASMRPVLPDLSLDSACRTTTIMNFRHSAASTGPPLFKTINRWLAEAGVMMTQGTLVDATIIEAPSSTKNKSSNAIRRCIRPRKAISGTLA
jgi:IS5 family transposase